MKTKPLFSFSLGSLLLSFSISGFAQGTAFTYSGRLEEGGAPELLQRLAHVYLGPDVKFPPMDDPPPGVTMRIEVDRVAGIGPWAPR